MFDNEVDCLDDVGVWMLRASWADWTSRAGQAGRAGWASWADWSGLRSLCAENNGTVAIITMISFKNDPE